LNSYPPETENDPIQERRLRPEGARTGLPGPLEFSNNQRGFQEKSAGNFLAPRRFSAAPALLELRN
jgi:hypothetical protein